MTIKLCNKCLTEKSFDLFSKDKAKSDGLCTICKDCARANRKAWYEKNKEKVKEYQANYERENREQVRERSRAWRKNNRDRFLSKRRNYHAERYSNDLSYSVNHKVRSMLRRVLKATNKPKDFCTFEKIGYTTDDLIQRMECQFKGGMNWGNSGEWEIDHKIPIAIMVKRGEFRPEIINALSNLQPMWMEQNRSKGARYIG